MRIVVCFFFVVTIFPSSASFAGCLYKEESRDVINQRIYDEAAFVGLIKIEQTISLDNNPKIINEVEYNRLSEVLVIRPYKGQANNTLKVYWTYHPLNRPMPPILGDVGKVYERSIKKIGDDFVYYIGCQRPLYEEYMVNYRSEAKETPLFIEDYKKPCQTQGGAFTNQSDGAFFDCFFPSKDEGKACSDNSECEGGCFTDVSYEEAKEHAKTQGINILLASYKYEEGIEKEGTCSKFTNPKGSFLSVENGKTKRINMEGED